MLQVHLIAGNFELTDNKEIVNSFNLSWGIRPFYFDKSFASTDEMIESINNILLEKGLVQKGDLVINTASMPIDGTFRTNMIKMSIV